MLTLELLQALDAFQTALTNQLATVASGKLGNALRTLQVSDVSDVLYFNESREVATQNPELLYLTEIVTHQKIPSMVEADGALIRYADTQMFQARDGGKAVHVPPSSGGHNSAGVMLKNLGISRKSRVNVLVYARKQRIGMLTLVLPGELGQVDVVMYKYFAEQCATILSNFWETYFERKREEFDAEFTREIRHFTSSRDLARYCAAFARVMRRVLQTSSASVFQLDPYGRQLICLAEDFRHGLKPASLVEEYISGAHGSITGRAFAQANWRLVCDLEPLYENPVFRDKLAWRCIERLTEAGEKPKTVTCAVFPQQRPMFLVRLVNRNDPDRKLFIIRDKILLEDFAEHFARIAVPMMFARQWSNLSEAIANSSRQPANAAQTLRDVANALHLGVGRHALFVFGAKPYGNETVHPKLVLADSEDLQQRLAEANPMLTEGLLAEAFTKHEIVAVAIDQLFEGSPARKGLVEALCGTSPSKFGKALLVRGTGSRHIGVLIVTIPGQLGGDLDDVERLGRTQAEILRSAANMLTASAEAQVGKTLYDQAEEFVAEAKRQTQVAGHELASPLNRFSQIAQALVADIVDLRNIAMESSFEAAFAKLMKLEVETYEREIGEIARDTKFTIEMAQDLAMTTERVIDLNPRLLSLHTVFEAARKHTLANVRPLDKSGAPVQVQIDSNVALSQLPEIEGDPVLLTKVFINVLANAVKYSIAPGRGERIKVAVYGQGQQGWQIVQVRNWGVPLPPDRWDRIFSAFERGNVRDPHQARRGLGIGLYICKRIVEAHRGTIRVVRSAPTFDDPQRRENEGWETVFEFRLPVKRGG